MDYFSHFFVQDRLMAALIICPLRPSVEEKKKEKTKGKKRMPSVNVSAKTNWLSSALKADTIVAN